MSEFGFSPEKMEAPSNGFSVDQKLIDCVHRLQTPDTSVDQPKIRELMVHQESFVQSFIDYLKEVVETRQKYGPDAEPRMARIVSAPRTGKTTMCAEIFRRTGLPGVYFVPSKNLVPQAVAELRKLLPQKRIAIYSGDQKDSLKGTDIIVSTYQMAQSEIRMMGDLPPEVKNMPLIFADEGHESTTDKRLSILQEKFDPAAIRVALTGTPDYNNDRRLEQFYPDLIHILTTPEAVELGLLSPFKYWVYSIDIDASKVEINAGDFNPGQIGRIFTGLPVFKFLEHLRYHKTNKDIPALICFRTKQQASDAAAYLERVKPEGAKKIGLVIEDTKNREAILNGFSKGEYDTLITVHVLLRGWDAPECKLLLDFDPSLSPVKCGQKFTRPLTKTDVSEANRVAKIFCVIPRGLRYQPITPPDVLVNTESDYPQGRVIGAGTTQDPRSEPSPILPLPDGVEAVSVQPATEIKDHGSLEPINIDRENISLIRSIIRSGYAAARETTSQEAWLATTIFSPFSFKRTFFDHPIFKGYGRTLLWAIGIKTKKEFTNFVIKAFPEASATLLLANHESDVLGHHHPSTRRLTIKKQSYDVPTAKDAQHLLNAIAEERTPKAQGIAEGARALFGPDDEPPLDDAYSKKDRNSLWLAWQHLSDTEKKVIKERFVNDKTYEEIGPEIDQGLSRERIRKIINNEALPKLKRWIQYYSGPRGIDGQQVKTIDTKHTNLGESPLDKKEREVLKTCLLEEIQKRVNAAVQSKTGLTRTRKVKRPYLLKATKLLMDELSPEEQVLLFYRLGKGFSAEEAQNMVDSGTEATQRAWQKLEQRSMQLAELKINEIE